MNQNHKHIRHCLEQIIQSSVFSKSTINRELLKYLVESSMNGENPKEYQIAADVFGRKANSEKEINVRVYIHNLRKKLDEYYQKEGKDDEFVLAIPKGEYRVQFQYSQLKLIKKKLLLRAPALLGISFFILAISVFMIFYYPYQKTKIEIWKPFLKKDYPVFLVLGDHYFFRSQIATGKMSLVRDLQINSDADYDHFLEQNPSKIGEMTKSDLTYVNNQAPIGLFYIMNILAGGGAESTMNYSSRVRMEDFRGQHVIYIGSFKSLQFLLPTTEKMGIKYQIENSLLEFQTSDSTFRYNNHSDEFLIYEYACVSHFVTNDGRHVLFFLCDIDIGNIALVKYFTEKESIRPLEKALDQLGKENFKAVFEVKGQGRTDFEMKLVRIDSLDENISDIWP